MRWILRAGISLGFGVCAGGGDATYNRDAEFADIDCFSFARIIGVRTRSTFRGSPTLMTGNLTPTTTRPAFEIDHETSIIRKTLRPSVSV